MKKTLPDFREGFVLPQKSTSLRGAEGDVAIPWIFKHFRLIIQRLPSIWGIATPVCGLVRDDVLIFRVL